jgi:hypothetical protein
MGHGPQARQHSGGMNQDVELPVPREYGAAQSIDAPAVQDIEGHKGGREAAETADLVVKLFKRALRAAYRHDLDPRRRQRQGAGPANPAGGTGHHGHPAG